MKLKRAYAWFWRATWVFVAGVIWWTQFGEAMVRRHCCLPDAPAESVRTADHFVALLFPKIVEQPAYYAITQKDFEAILGSLKSLGYYPIGLEDVRQLYKENRLLPEKSVLIALDRDEPKSAQLADESLKKLHMRGAIFLAAGAARAGRYKRSWLSKHALTQMSKGGTWSFGMQADTAATPETRQFLYGKKEQFRFKLSPTGFNDTDQDPDSLNIMRIRTERAAHETVELIHKIQPRRIALVDEFNSPRWKSEWLIGAGAASAANKKLVILPMPGHTSAAVYLTGTEDWEDMVLEFTLKRFEKSFWAYCRYQDSGTYMRIGVGGNEWLLEQKSGSGPPNILARTPMDPSDLPATVRLLLKGNWAIVYINGAMQFGKALRLSPTIHRGRVHLGVYDKEPRSAIAVLSMVKAKPLGTKWVALTSADLASPSFQERLREELLEASVISPQWFHVAKDGNVTEKPQEHDTIWFQAGYYRCRLMPLFDLAAAATDLTNSAVAKKLAAHIADRIQSLGADGANLVLSKAQAHDSKLFIEELGEKIRAQKTEMWVTWAEDQDPDWTGKVNDTLQSIARPVPGMQILQTVKVNAGADVADAAEAASWK